MPQDNINENSLPMFVLGKRRRWGNKEGRERKKGERLLIKFYF